MALKYIDISAANNGDGTSSAQAASAGAAGAWNSFQNVLKGNPTFGALVAGDQVYVRTYNGGNLTEYLAASVTSTIAGTVAAPVDFIFDTGVVWPTGGVFALYCHASGLTTNYTVTLSNYCNLFASNYNFVITRTSAAAGASCAPVGRRGLSRRASTYACSFRQAPEAVGRA